MIRILIQVLEGLDAVVQGIKLLKKHRKYWRLMEEMEKTTEITDRRENRFCWRLVKYHLIFVRSIENLCLECLKKSIFLCVDNSPKSCEL